MKPLKAFVRVFLITLGSIFFPAPVQRSVDGWVRSEYQRGTKVPAFLEHAKTIRRLFSKRPDYRMATLTNDMCLSVDISDSLGLNIYLNAPTSDAFELQLLSALVRPGDVCIDVGANIGLYTVLMAAATGPAGKIYAFEPAPRTFEILRSNIEANGLKTVIATAAAISDAKGSATLHLTAETGLTSLGNTNRGTVVATADVPTLTLDAFAREHGIDGIDFLKIDVEGYEGHVLRGGASLLETAADPLLMIELDGKNFKALGFSKQGVLDSLRAKDFDAFLIDRRRQKLVPLEQAADGGGINYLFYRTNSARKDELIKFT